MRGEAESPPSGGDPLFPSGNPELLGPPGSAAAHAEERTGELDRNLPPRDSYPIRRYDARTREEVQLPARHVQVSQEPRLPVPGRMPRCFFKGEGGSDAGGGGSVFPPDGRTEIADTTEYPYRAIGKIYSWFHDTGDDDGQSCQDGNEDVGCADCVGTGALVGPCHVLTAGHVVYNHDPQCGSIGWATKLVFVPALYTDGAGVVRWPYGSQRGTKFYSYEAWTQDEDENHDWCFVVLDQAIGETTGWFGYSTGDSDGETRNISGYPTDRSSGLDQFWMNGPIDCENTYNLKYEIDTFGGQSGAPIWRRDGDDRYVHGVHTTGNVAFACGFETKNRGVRITSGKFDDIQDWKAENPCPEEAAEADLADDGDDSTKFDPDNWTLRPLGKGRLLLGIRDIGVRPSEPCRVAVFLLPESLPADPTPVGASPVPALECFQPVAVRIDICLPEAVEAGKYHLGWVIDPDDRVPEFNERNNRRVLRSRMLTVLPRRQDFFRRGEVTEDGKFDISDPVSVFGYLFLGGRKPRCLRAADANDDGKVDISDGVLSLSALFLGGVDVRPPGPFACGLDPTPDDIDCEMYSFCQ